MAAQKQKLKISRFDGRVPHVKSIDVLLEDYGLPVPDEWGGPENSKYFFDYGPPEILADSARGQDRTKHEQQLGASLQRLVNTP